MKISCSFNIHFWKHFYRYESIESNVLWAFGIYFPTGMYHFHVWLVLLYFGTAMWKLLSWQYWVVQNGQHLSVKLWDWESIFIHPSSLYFSGVPWQVTIISLPGNVWISVLGWNTTGKVWWCPIAERQKTLCHYDNKSMIFFTYGRTTKTDVALSALYITCLHRAYNHVRLLERLHCNRAQFNQAVTY